MQKIILALFVVLILGACGTPTVNVPAFDPNVAAVQSENEARLYSMMATGTAQAPIIHITETAAAVSVIGTQADIDKTSTAVLWTATATPIPSLTQTATPDATQTVVFDSVNNILEDSRRANERQNTINNFFGILPAVIFGLIAGAVILGLVWFGKRERYKPAATKENGQVIPILDTTRGTVTDVERMPNYRGNTSNEDVIKILLMLLMKKLDILPELPMITDLRQDVVTERKQMIDLRARVGTLPRRLVDSQGGQSLLSAGVDIAAPASFLLPDWDIINGWDSKDGLPYYTARGLEVFDNDRFPHLSVLGGTGTGKSRRFLRPLIACALAAGHRVIIVGKSTDYQTFINHPNATLLKINKITEPGQAQRYAQILDAIVQEMNRRDDVLTARGVSTWTRAGYYRTIIVLDEFGNALRLMDKQTSAQSRILAEGLVMEGRKVGFNIWLSNQRATGMASMLSQTGKAIFRVEPDEEKAHRALQGASGLSDGYYLARFGAQKLAGGFEPSDPQLMQFMASRPVVQLEPDQWIDAIVTPVDAALPNYQRAQIPADPPQETAYSLVNGLNGDELKIIEFHQAGGYDVSDIAQAVYNDVAAVGKVAEILRRYKISQIGVEAFTMEVLSRMHAAGKVSLSQAQREIYGADDPRGGKHFLAVQQIWMSMQGVTATATQAESGAIHSNITGSSSNIATGSGLVA